MPFMIDNIRLRELALVAESNKPIFDDFVGFIRSQGYPRLYDFVASKDGERAQQALRSYLMRPLPEGVMLYDGIARPYGSDKAKWLLLGWIFRDAPEQRLRPMLSSLPGNSSTQKKVVLFNTIREYAALVFTDPAKWEWVAISEVVIDRLEGSRRSIKGTLFEAIVRTQLQELFEQDQIDLTVHNTEVRLEGETYDVKVTGTRGSILLPVKTRETMGGGHAGLFTRDIHKSISVAHKAGYECVPVIIAESWVGDLVGLGCEQLIYIDRNPNQVPEVRPLLAEQLATHIAIFRNIV